MDLEHRRPTLGRTTPGVEFATTPGAVRLHHDRVAVQDRLMQPVAAAAVAEVLVEQALTPDPAGMVQVGGPECMLRRELTAAVLRHGGDERPVVAADPPIPELRTGELLPPDGSLIVGPTVAGWLAHLDPHADPD